MNESSTVGEGKDECIDYNWHIKMPKVLKRCLSVCKHLFYSLIRVAMCIVQVCECAADLNWFQP